MKNPESNPESPPESNPESSAKGDMSGSAGPQGRERYVSPDSTESGIRNPKSSRSPFREYVFAFTFILSLFYVNPRIVRYIFYIYFIYAVIRSAVRKRYYPRNRIMAGICLFAVGTVISVIFSPNREMCYDGVKYLFTALGAVLMYLDVVKGQLSNGRPPLVWPEIGGIWIIGTLVAGYFFRWTEAAAPMYEPFFRATSVTSGYIGLVITSFIAVNLLTALYRKTVQTSCTADEGAEDTRKFIPPRGYWIFLGILAPLMAARVSYYLQQKGFIDNRLWPTVGLAVMFWAVSFLWLYSGRTRAAVGILCITGCGYLAYLSWSRSAFFPYFVLLIMAGNIGILIRWSKKRFLLAAGYTCFILAVFGVALHMFMFWDRTRGGAQQGESAVEQVIHLTKREGIFRASWNMWKDYPLTGVGFNKKSFHELFPSYHPTKREVAHAHNLYLHVLATQGIVGLACLLFLCWALLSVLIKHISSGNEIRAVFFLPVLMMLVLGLMHYPLISYRFLNGFFTFGIAAASVYGFKSQLKVKSHKLRVKRMKGESDGQELSGS